MRLLVPTDGSDGSLRAVDFAIEFVRRTPGAEIHMVHVRRPLPQAITDFVDSEFVRSFHEECVKEALQPAAERLEAAGISFHRHGCVGEPGAVIAKMATVLGCEQIIMGTQGLGAVAEILLGSVARRVVYDATVPVTLVK